MHLLFIGKFYKYVRYQGHIRSFYDLMKDTGDAFHVAC